VTRKSGYRLGSSVGEVENEGGTGEGAEIKAGRSREELAEGGGRRVSRRGPLPDGHADGRGRAAGEGMGRRRLPPALRDAPAFLAGGGCR